jgi:hypothetical protein
MRCVSEGLGQKSGTVKRESRLVPKYTVGGVSCGRGVKVIGEDIEGMVM